MSIACDFCHKPEGPDDGKIYIVAKGGKSVICSECVAVCVDVIEAKTGKEQES